MEPCTEELIYEMAGSFTANAKDARIPQNSEHIARHLFVLKQVQIHSISCEGKLYTNVLVGINFYYVLCSSVLHF